MNIEVKIIATGLSAALMALAEAIKTMGGASVAPTAPTTPTEPEAPVDTLDAVEDEQAAELKPSDIKKQKIADKITALGGTPPEKGAVAKFQAVLDKLEAEAAEAAAADDEDLLDGGDDEDLLGGDDDEDLLGGDDIDTEDTPEPNLDNVRVLACAVIQKDPDNPKKGKAALAGCLKIVKAKKVSEATAKQLVALVPHLEEYLGKSFAQVIKEEE